MRYIFAAFYISALSLFSFSGEPGAMVTGRVTDKTSNLPVAGAAVVVVKTKETTSTAADGSFRIAASKGATLSISAAGYETAKVKVASDTGLIDVKLALQTGALEEIAVTGYAPIAQLSGRAPGLVISHKTRRQKSTHFDKEEDRFNTEEYAPIAENRFRSAKDAPLSTFSIDVDAASYSNMRRYLRQRELPPAGAVRVEEMINYFSYEYPQPREDHPFSINTEISDCAWNNKHKLVMIGLQGRTVPADNLPASNLVFLIDVSGSMMDENKLPLVKSSLKLLVNQLRENDRVAIVVYAGSAGLVLPSVSGWQKQQIRDAIDGLEAGGSTAGGQGIQLAYKVAAENFIEKGNNRIILCTDGDFNVGASSDAAMEKLIEEKRKSGVYLTVLGYGMGNYKDSKMQRLAEKGNGNHAYIDSESEAKKVLVNEFGGTLFTIANDVKLQIEFNPARVQAYRLVGYESRLLNNEDFNNDKKDAGELGSGHTVTALYEIIPAGVASSFLETIDPLKYQRNKSGGVSHADEIVTVKFRYKLPGEQKSRLIEKPLADNHVPLESASTNFRFASAVAGFGMLLTNSEFRQQSSFERVRQMASGALGTDREGYRAEFLELVTIADRLMVKR